MARLVVIVAALLLVCSAVYAQQLVSCTFIASGRQNSPNTFSRSGVTQCYQLDGLNGALESGEVAAPSSTTLTINNDGSSALPVDACAPTNCDKSSIACATDAKAIYGKVRELRLRGQIINNDQSSISARASGGKLGYSSDTTNSIGTLIYRLDGQGSCGTAAGAPGPYTVDFNLRTAAGLTLTQMGDAFEIVVGSDLATTVTIDIYGTSASTKSTITIQVSGGTSDSASAINYIIPFSSFSGSSDAFSNTGAIEVSFGGENRDTSVYFLDVIPLASTSVSARVFQDCGCNGFTADDTVQSGVSVTLSVSGTGSCTGGSTQTTTTSGTVSFTNLPSGCTYTLSTSGLTLCSNSASTQTVPGLGNADFAILGTTGSLQIPADKTIPCGGDTSVSANGQASVAGGSCGGSSGPASSTDTVTSPACTTPGGAILVVKRAWTGAGQTLTQTITVVDAGAITFTNVPASTTVTCNDALPNTQATATACTSVTVTSVDSTAISACDTASCTASQTITRTFTARDQCGSTAARTQTITRTGCAPNCPTPTPPNAPPPPPNAPPPPTNLPTNANCRFICDDDDSSAAGLFVSVLLAALLAVVAAF